MLNAFGGSSNPPPPVPPRGVTATPSSTGAFGTGPNKEQKDKVGNVRESIGILFVFTISVAVLSSSAFIFKYALRDRTVYEEMVDYLDKTVSISKINYNVMLGVYELKPSELDGLDEHRKYKSLMWAFLLADLSSLLLFAISAFFYFSAETSKGLIRVLFWIFLLLGLLFALVEMSLFTFLISPYLSKLPNSTVALLDHAIPYNPGGLAQMEQKFGCIFDQNLYETFKRQMNPRNTCDPYLLSSFVPKSLLVVFISLRLVLVLIFLSLVAAPQSSLSTSLFKCIVRVKPAIRYKKNVNGTPAKKLPPYYSHNSPTKTTFGVKENVPISSPLPIGTQIPPKTPPLGHLDHRINYNNAAFFAVSGANPTYSLGSNIVGVNLGGGRSSRSSEISITKCGGDNLATSDPLRRQMSFSHLGSTHTTNSLVSEV
uniref:Chloride channel CLIC-like protein 1 n=1 Tax=Globodera pallida TaxID=36090 RepID=A0A183BM18_GLOPA